MCYQLYSFIFASLKHDRTVKYLSCCDQTINTLFVIDENYIKSDDAVSKPSIIF